MGISPLYLVVGVGHHERRQPPSLMYRWPGGVLDNGRILTGWSRGAAILQHIRGSGQLTNRFVEVASLKQRGLVQQVRGTWET